MIHRDSIEFTTALALGAVLGVSMAWLLSSREAAGTSRGALPRLVARTKAGGDVEVRLRSTSIQGVQETGRRLLRRLSDPGGRRHSGGNGRRG